MSSKEKRDRKFVVSLTESEEAALLALADLRDVPRAVAARTILRDALMGQPVEQSTPPGAPPTPMPPSGDGGLVPWLAPEDEQELAQWQRWAADASKALRKRYPELADQDLLPSGWQHDSFTRDALLALAVHREELDSGQHTDPRMELMFERSLRELTSWLQARKTTSGPRAQWLQRDRDASWRQWAWNAGEALRARYPELAEGNSALPASWPLDPGFRESVLALAVWRQELDDGHHQDPRMELAFQRAVQDFSRSIRERRTYATTAHRPAAEPRQPPQGWTG